MKHLGCIIISCLIILSTPMTAAGAIPGEYPGKSYLLMELETGTVLQAKNEHQALPPASVTKVMTLLLIMEAIDNQFLDWSDMVTASDSAAAKGGSQIYLKAGEIMTVEEMVKSIAVSSANDCACAMAEHLAGSESSFVEKMNQKAEELGMNDTCFVNCTGLDDSDEAGTHKTSAYDIALMSRELLLHHPTIKKFTTIWMDSVRNGSFGLSNTNKLIRFYPGATGLKTGFTSSAGYCLSASASRDGMELISVVMGCESSQERFSVCKQLMDYGFSTYTLYTPEIPDSITVPVARGKAPQISAVPEVPGKVLSEKSSVGQITTEITLLPQVHAPVAEQFPLGELIIRKNEEILTRIPMVASASVERKTFMDYFSEILGIISMKSP